MYFVHKFILVPQVYAYVQTHQIVYSKYVQSFGYQLHLNEAVKK